MELREGRYQDVLADVVADALIVDPPYSAVTSLGHNASVLQSYDGAQRRSLDYSYWTGEDVTEFV